VLDGCYVQQLRRAAHVHLEMCAFAVACCDVVCWTCRVTCLLAAGIPSYVLLDMCAVLCCAVLCCTMLCCAVSAGDLTGGRWGPFWDKLVFSKIRERVGGEVKYMTTGGWEFS
jgi:hypothetical protein